MFNNASFYHFVAFTLALSSLSIPLVGQYDNASLPVLIFGVFYLMFFMWVDIVHMDKELFPLVRFFVYLVYVALSARTAYTSLVIIFQLGLFTNYVLFFLGFISCCIFTISSLHIFIRNYDKLIHFFY